MGHTNKNSNGDPGKNAAVPAILEGLTSGLEFSHRDPSNQNQVQGVDIVSRTKAKSSSRR